MSFTVTNKDLAEFAIKCYEDGVRYWYGTCYYKCTDALLASKAKQYPAHYGSERTKTYQAAIKAGFMCCDCVGLIKGALWSELGTRTAKYNTNGCPDRSANGMLDYCKSQKMPNGGMDTFPDTPGLLLHKSGHVGVSIGGGYAIEARGFAYGVVKTKISGRGWTSWAQLPFVQYGDAAPEPVERHLLDRVLKRGMQGNDVAEMQALLDAAGYSCGTYGPDKNGIDGDFGYTTEAAVKAFQTAAGLEIDGHYGPKTHAFLLKAQATGLPEQPDEGSADDAGCADTPTFTVTIYGVNGADATYLLETYPNAKAEKEGPA